MNCRYIQMNWRYLQIGLFGYICNSIADIFNSIGDISNSIADMCTSIADIFNSVNKCENGAPYKCDTIEGMHRRHDFPTPSGRASAILEIATPITTSVSVYSLRVIEGLEPELSICALCMKWQHVANLVLCHVLIVKRYKALRNYGMTRNWR